MPLYNRETSPCLMDLRKLYMILESQESQLETLRICPPVKSNLKGFFNILFIIYFERREGRKREISMCGCLSHAPHWGPGPQPRHVPWLGTELVTLWFTGRRSIHWATPARADLKIFMTLYLLPALTLFKISSYFVSFAFYMIFPSSCTWLLL